MIGSETVESGMATVDTTGDGQGDTSWPATINGKLHEIRFAEDDTPNATTGSQDFSDLVAHWYPP